jgi:2,3-bisphosphoglycerate-dependent phosphoglycerate mutase
MHNISDKDVMKSNVPTSRPLVYELDSDLRPIDSACLGDPEKVRRAMEAVAKQGKAASASWVFPAR